MGHVYVFKRLLQYVAKYKSRLSVIIILGLVGVFFEVAKPLPMKLIIDNVLSGLPLPDFFHDVFGNTIFFASRTNILYTSIAVMLSISVCSFFMTLFVFNKTVKLSQGLVFDLMIDFYSKLQQMSLSFYSRNKVGDLLQRMTSDVFVVYFVVAQILIPAITSLVCLGAMFYIMFSIDYVLAIVAFSVVPLLAVLLALFAGPMNNTTTLQYQSQGLFSAFLQQSLSSIKIIQAFGREPFMQAKLRKHAEEFSSAYISANRVSITFNQLTFLVTAVATAMLVLLGAYRGLSGNVSIGELFIFLGYLSALYGPVNSLTTAVGASIQIGARGKRVFEILDSDEIIRDKSDAIKLHNVRGSVEFRNVSFDYAFEGKGNPVLQNISFKVSPGQVVALVGPTGTGKTSLISLLVRFYEPKQGTIFLDDTDISEIDLHSLRQNVSLVLQDPFIFPMTIAENIAFGNPDATFEEIVEAAKGAQADSFIKRLPDGYETVISEAGSSLSGGEKQRIAIARAFLKKSPVMIFDEPTSAVDALTEAKIFEALRNFSVGRTVFLISHRLSTIKHADQIITISDGRVVEKGTHQSLIKEDKVYARLYKYQHIS